MTCRKLAFDTVEAAERTASVVAGLRGNEGKVPVRIYECPACGKLHFTSSPERPDSSTVAKLEIVPAFTASDWMAGKEPPPITPCASCGKDGASVEWEGKRYHKTCRAKLINAAGPEARARFDHMQALDGARRMLEAAGYTVTPPEVHP